MDRNNQSKLLFEKIKTVKNRVFQPKQLAIKDHQGAMLTDPDKIMDRWKEYGEKHFDSPSASNSPLPPPQEDIVTEPPPLRSERELAEEQAGIRPGRGTGDMLCAIQILIEKLIETINEAYIIFIDYSKAFDSVNHSELFTTLSRMGLPMHIARLFQALYTDQEAKIRWNGSHTDSFKIGK